MWARRGIGETRRILVPVHQLYSVWNNELAYHSYTGPLSLTTRDPPRSPTANPAPLAPLQSEHINRLFHPLHLFRPRKLLIRQPQSRSYFDRLAHRVLRQHDVVLLHIPYRPLPAPRVALEAAIRDCSFESAHFGQTGGKDIEQGRLACAGSA